MVVYYDEDNFSIKLYRDCVKGELVGLTEVIPIDELLEVWADRKTENCSEKPNNCEKDCFLCKWLGEVDVCGRCRNRNLFAEADTEPKPKDEPQTEEWYTYQDEQEYNDRWQTDCAWK